MVTQLKLARHTIHGWLALPYLHGDEWFLLFCHVELVDTDRERTSSSNWHGIGDTVTPVHPVWAVPSPRI